MVQRVETNNFGLNWSRKNRRIAFLHNAEIAKGNEIPIRDILEKKKL